jgi:hypothetical protein
MVHYVSHGTPPREDGSQTYHSECRAAVITAVPAPDEFGTVYASLCVINPTGLFFNEYVVQDQGEPFDLGDPHPALCGGRAYAGGSWHWPQRV